MKKYLFAALSFILLFITACSDHKDQILVRFQNSLPENINDAQFEFGEDHLTTIGQIQAGSKTDYIDFNYFEVGDGWPMGILKGEKEGVQFSAWSGLWCGTGVDFKQLEPGKYTLEIVRVGDDSLGYYQIKFLE